MSTVLVDFSQLVISSVVANSKDMRGDDPDDMNNFIKHIALTSLLKLKSKFNGKLIICCDSKHYWRKEVFPSYKGHRKHRRQDSDIDFNAVYKCLDEMKQELRDNFPYMVLEVIGAEADDIIGTLVKYYSENEFDTVGLVEEPKDIVIGSSDGDFKQLHKYLHVTQWNNARQEFVTCDDPKKYLIEHICCGDTNDNIPSIVNDSSWSEARANNISVRAKPFKQSRLLDFYGRGIDACLDENEQINYRRNEQLVDLDMIPQKVTSKILSAYLNYEFTGSKAKVFNYLMSKRMKLLLASANNF
jgi:hypothetical protein